MAANEDGASATHSGVTSAAAEPDQEELDDEPVSIHGPAPGFLFQPRPGAERPLHREKTAQQLGIGIFVMFAVSVVFVAASHLAAIIIMRTPPDPKLTTEQVDAWFRWREQYAASVTSFTQMMSALLAGPLGVVLGFYFRDRDSK